MSLPPCLMDMFVFQSFGLSLMYRTMRMFNRGINRAKFDWHIARINQVMPLSCRYKYCIICLDLLYRIYIVINELCCISRIVSIVIREKGMNYKFSPNNIYKILPKFTNINGFLGKFVYAHNYSSEVYSYSLNIRRFRS